jgi:hypothetical protein
MNALSQYSGRTRSEQAQMSVQNSIYPFFCCERGNNYSDVYPIDLKHAQVTQLIAATHLH